MRLRWRKLAGAALFAAITLILLELAMRVIGMGFATFHQPDSLLGLAHVPGASGLFTTEGRAAVTINSAGYRDLERSVEPSPHTFRVAVIGDSYTEALQVEREETFVARLEDELGARDAVPGRTVEALNFGCSGYGTGQELLLLRERVLAYRPDWVLVAFLSGNDVSDNVRQLKGVDYVPYFDLRAGELILDDSFHGSEAFARRTSAGAELYRRVLPHSRVLQAVNRVRTNVGAQAQQSAARADAERGVDAGLAAAVYREPDATWEAAWRLTEALLVAMAEIARGAGTGFGVVVLTNPIQVHPDGERRRRLSEALGVGDLLYPERRLHSFGAEHGIAVLTLAQPFAAHVQRTGRAVHGFGDDLGGGHWNEDGHRLAAELIADWLAPQLGAVTGR